MSLSTFARAVAFVLVLFTAARMEISIAHAGDGVVWYGGEGPDGLAEMGGVWDFEDATLQGWTSEDLTDTGVWFQWSPAASFATDPVNGVIDGTASMYLGMHEFDALTRCWPGRQGYGNDWDQSATKVFTYSGAGDVTIQFDYYVDSEPGHDFTYVYMTNPFGITHGPLNTSANPNVAGFGYSGWGVNGTSIGSPSLPAHETIVIPGSRFNIGGPFEITFRFESDELGSDQIQGFCLDPNAAFPGSSPGPFAFDNFQITGIGISDFDDFEVDAEGWMTHQADPAGAFLTTEDLFNLPPIGACPVSGQVMLAEDLVQPPAHPEGQIERLYSNPFWTGGSFDCVRARLDVWEDISTGVRYRIGLRYYPWSCPSTAVVGWSEDMIWERDYRAEGTPTCHDSLGVEFLDWSLAGAAAPESLQLVIEIRSDAPSPTTITPYFDNIRLGLVTGGVCSGGASTYAPGTLTSVDWNDPAVWTPDGVPNGTPAIIPGGQRLERRCEVNATPATDPTDVTVASGACMTTLALSGGATTLTATGNVLIDDPMAALEVTDAGLDATGDLSNDGLVRLLGSATVTVATPSEVNNRQLFVVKSGATATLDADMTTEATGSLLVETGANLTILGTHTLNGTMLIDGTCTGCRGGASTLTTDRTIAATAASVVMGQGEWFVHGDWDLAIDNPESVDLRNGQIHFIAASASDENDIECLAENVGGMVSPAFSDVFWIGEMTLSGAGTVKLVNTHDNSGTGNPEALYVGDLVFEPGSTLDLAGLSLFYENVVPSDPQAPGSGVTVLDSKGGGQLLPVSIVDVGGVETPAANDRLRPSIPNPVRAAAAIPFELRRGGRVSLRLYDVGGRLVRTLIVGDVLAGLHEARWDGLDERGVAAPAGVYFYVLEGASVRLTRKLTYMP